MRLLGVTLRPKLFVRELKFAWAALLGRDDADRRLFLRVTDDPALAGRFARLAGEHPPGSMVNASGTLVRELRDWRTHFTQRLSGHGLEIGPLHQPLVPHSSMTVDYLDRLSLQDLRREYPELAACDIVEPTLIGDAESLSGLADERYDFVVAAHVLEHLRNPVRALENWVRVLRPGGLLYLIVPDKRLTFDRGRPRTTLEHLIVDYHRPSAERDYEHYVEYALHVHLASAGQALAEADRLAEADYSIHFHVFLPDDVVRLIGWVGEQVCRLRIVEGPVAAPDGDEFHLLVRCKL